MRPVIPSDGFTPYHLLSRGGQLSRLHTLSGQARGIHDPLALSFFILQIAFLDMNQLVYSSTSLAANFRLPLLTRHSGHQYYALFDRDI